MPLQRFSGIEPASDLRIPGRALPAWGAVYVIFVKISRQRMMFTLMRSKNTPGKECPAGIKAYEQQEVARFATFENAVEECSAANVRLSDRHYVTNASGKEYFQGAWID